MGKKGKEDRLSFEDLNEKYFKKYPPAKHKFVHSGSVALDYLFGGGVPLGKVILLTSPPALGKSLCSVFMCYGLLSNEDGFVLYIDAERGVTESLVEKVIPEDLRSRFILRTPNIYEEISDMVVDYVSTGKLLGVFIDSITSVFPKIVMEEDKHPIGAKANAENLFCMKMKIYASMYNFAVVYVNQQRAVNIMTRPSLGPAGGWALKHYNDIMVSMHYVTKIRSPTGDIIGAHVKMECEKNKLVGNRSVTAFLKYGQGISNIATVVATLKYGEYIKQGGSYFEIDISELKIKEKVRGNEGVEKVVSEHFEKILDFIEKKELFKEYFENSEGGKVDASKN